ncbi:MAG: hypothetical protein K2W99_00735 [Chthoniobacterales bacterium]|nr:hypothetical protein [Chthoniobacterales bacterium]
MNSLPKKIESSGSAFQQPSLQHSTNNGKTKKPSSASVNGHTVENLPEPHLPKAISTTSLRSGASTTVEDLTPQNLSSHKIQQSDSSVSLQETNSNSRSTFSSASEKPIDDVVEEKIESELFSGAQLPVVKATPIPGESAVHRGLRIFLREEMDLILTCRFEMQKAQATCHHFIEQWEEEHGHAPTPLKDSLLHQASRVEELQAEMIRETDSFVNLDIKSSLNQAINLPVPNRQPKMLDYLKHLTECATDLNKQLEASKEAIHAIDQTNDPTIRRDLTKAAKLTIKALEYRLIAFTAILNKENQTIIDQNKKSAKYADYATQCSTDAAKIPEVKAQYLQQATENLNIQAPHPTVESILEVMTLAHHSLQKAITAYERAMLAASSVEETIRQQEENYNEIALNHDNAFGRFQDAAAFFAIGDNEVADLLKQEALTSSKAAKYQGFACALELSEDFAQYQERATTFREIAALYKDASNLFFEAIGKINLASEAENDGVVNALLQEAQELHSKAINIANEAFQEQEALEATFPANILAQLMLH